MGKLYGRMQGNRGEVTRMGHQDIYSSLETWQGSIRTYLNDDGSYRVEIGPKNGPGRVVLTGNVGDAGERTAYAADRDSMYCGTKIYGKEA